MRFIVIELLRINNEDVILGYVGILPDEIVDGLMNIITWR